MTDELFARVLYDYVPEVQESDPASALLAVEKDSYLRILNNDDPSWWLAQKLHKDEIGWLPGHFVELVNATEALQSDNQTNEIQPQTAQETTVAPTPTPVVSNTSAGNANRHSILNKRITSQPQPTSNAPTPKPTTTTPSPATTKAQVPPKRPARDNIPTNSPKDVRASQKNLTPVQKNAVRAQYNTKQRGSSAFPIRGILDRFLVSRSSQQSLVERNILISEVHPENPIPLRKDIVQACITYIESRALNEEGVYRISGHATEVRKLCNSFRGDFDLTKIDDPHIVIGAMKMYFREMVPPLIPFELYAHFLDSHQYEEDLQKCINALRDSVDRLPALNREVFQMLCKHLSNVAKNSAKNLMTPPNLAIVFGPNLLRPKRQDLKTTLYLDKNSEIVRNCIEFYEDVFVEKKEPAPAPVTSSRSNTLTSPPAATRERPVPPASIRKAASNSTSTSASQLPQPVQAITVVSESFALAKLQSALHDKLANSIAAIVEQEMKNVDLTSKDKQQLIVEVLKDKDSRIKELESLIYKMEAAKSKQSTSFYANRAKNIDAMLCLQCGHNNRTCLFLDCQHFAFCSKCADGFQGVCPLCNEAISSVRHLNVQ